MLFCNELNIFIQRGLAVGTIIMATSGRPREDGTNDRTLVRRWLLGFASQEGRHDNSIPASRSLCRPRWLLAGWLARLATRGLWKMNGWLDLLTMTLVPAFVTRLRRPRRRVPG